VSEPLHNGTVNNKTRWWFHVTNKVKLLRTYYKMRKLSFFVGILKWWGVLPQDYELISLTSQSFKNDPEWIKYVEGNAALFRGILEDYKKYETRNTRGELMIDMLEYAIALYQHDMFYRERFDWFLFEVLKKQGNLKLNMIFLNPNNWFPKGRGHESQKIYNSGTCPGVCKPDMVREYKDWYGVDITKDGVIPEFKG
jgi:hypothetical protein